eukprot:scaffold153492_cov17-Tisochrysis_lutea.AAC.1
MVLNSNVARQHARELHQATTREEGQAHKTRPQVLKSGIIFRPHPSEAPSKLGIPSGLYGAALLYDWNEERLDVVRFGAHEIGKYDVCRLVSCHV